MPGGGSHGPALTAREVASSSHPRLWFMGPALHGAREPEQETRHRAEALSAHQVVPLP